MTGPASGPLHVVVGARGQIGAHVVATLAERGARIRAVTRAPATPPVADHHRAVHGRDHDGDHDRAHGDIGDPADAIRLCAGADVIYACMGGPHATWAAELPRMTGGLLAGAARAGARVVFADNLYAYGAQDHPLTEDSPLRPRGGKPALRAEIAAQLLAADRRGEVPVAIARASDLYGPGVERAMAGAALVRSALAGRTLWLPGDLDAPHTFSYAPDVARAMIQLADADDVWGRVWHVPSAPALSLRALVAAIGGLAGTTPRARRLPTVAVRLAGLFARDVRELVELAFQWDRPYLVSHARFAARFGAAPTSIADGLRATAAWLARRAPAVAAGGPVSAPPATAR